MNSSPSLTAALPFSWQLSWPFSCLRSYVEPLTDSVLLTFRRLLGGFLNSLFWRLRRFGYRLRCILDRSWKSLGNRLFRLPRGLTYAMDELTRIHPRPSRRDNASSRLRRHISVELWSPCRARAQCVPGRRRRSPAPGSYRTWRAVFPHHALRQLVHSFHCYLFKFRFHGRLIFSLNRRP